MEPRQGRRPRMRPLRDPHLCAPHAVSHADELQDPATAVLEEIQRELRVVVQNTDHIVFMGYSLPPDDFTYRAFLAARIRKNLEAHVRCSVVDKQDGYESRWLYPKELQTKCSLPEAVTRAHQLFGPDNVRYFGAGIPDVFLEGGAAVTTHTVDRLLTWDRR